MCKEKHGMYRIWHHGIRHSLGVLEHIPLGYGGTTVSGPASCCHLKYIPMMLNYLSLKNKTKQKQRTYMSLIFMYKHIFNDHQIFKKVI